MEHIEFTIQNGNKSSNIKKNMAIAGVVASANLEVLMEKKDFQGECRFVIDTAADGFGNSWKAVATDFVERNKAAGLLILINDNAASPAVVSLRLDQAFEDITTE